MKRWLIPAAIGLAAMFAPAVAQADSPNNSVVGGGQQQGSDPAFFAISAHSNADSTNPRGSFTFENGPPGSHPWHADVTCLQVTGNDAIATGVVTQPADAAGQIVVAEAVDNGEPQRGQPVDYLRFSFESNGGVVQVSPDCWAPIFPPVLIEHGNIVVNDATLP